MWIATICEHLRLQELSADAFVCSCAQDAKVDKGTIHDIVLVGGSTRIPKVQNMLQDFFNGKVSAASLSDTATLLLFHAGALKFVACMCLLHRLFC